MPRLQNRNNPDIIVSISDTDPLPGSDVEWEPVGTVHRGSRRRANTGSVPVQRPDGDSH